MSETSIVPQEEKSGIIKYTPLGESAEITISRNILLKHVISPTRSGKTPNDHDLTSFIALCRAQLLNPLTKDVYLLGYDTKDGPSYSVITAKSALDKRAESHEEFDGYESGLVIESKDGEIQYKEGAICKVEARNNIIGAWCKVYRKDRSRPSHHEVNRDVYDTGKSRWYVDLPGMLIKCAEAGAIRKAFPNQFAGLYIEEEMSPEKVAVGKEVSQPNQGKSFVREEPIVPGATPIPERTVVDIPENTQETTSTRVCHLHGITLEEQSGQWLLTVKSGKVEADLIIDNFRLANAIEELPMLTKLEVTYSDEGKILQSFRAIDEPKSQDLELI